MLYSLPIASINLSAVVTRDNVEGFIFTAENDAGLFVPLTNWGIEKLPDDVVSLRCTSSGALIVSTPVPPPIVSTSSAFASVVEIVAPSEEPDSLNIDSQEEGE